jgi:HAD superfamily hydrolase (TIGR01549 family)
MKYALVIFDMDGTLTVDTLDFAAMRRDMGLPERGGILEQLAAMAPEVRAEKQAILHRHEMAAADRCGVQEGAVELLDHLRGAGVKTALLTRNSAACAERVLGRHALVLEHVRTREDLPHKPHPEAILSVTRKFGIDVRQTLMVGDYLYDLQTAAAAGCDSALYVPAEEALPEFAPMATYVVRQLIGLVKVVKGDA